MVLMVDFADEPRDVVVGEHGFAYVYRLLAAEVGSGEGLSFFTSGSMT